MSVKEIAFCDRCGCECKQEQSFTAPVLRSDLTYQVQDRVGPAYIQERADLCDACLRLIMVADLGGMSFERTKLWFERVKVRQPRKNKKVYAFGVDHTLDIAGGLLSVKMMMLLRTDGHIVGLCGNGAVVCRTVDDWHTFVSFMNPGSSDKVDYLKQVKMWIPSEDYVLVGSIVQIGDILDDKTAAERAGWRFISPDDFYKGVR